jgi:hypothetical protein
MLRMPAVGSQHVFMESEGDSGRGDLRSFASTGSLMEWLGDHARAAVVDGNSVIVTARIINGDWVGPVRLDLTTGGCYPVWRCLFMFTKSDALSSLHCHYYRAGQIHRLEYSLDRLASPGGLGDFIARGLHATDHRWRLECWTPAVTAEDRVVTVRNVSYRGRLPGSSEESRSPGVLTVSFADGRVKAEWRPTP